MKESLKKVSIMLIVMIITISGTAVCNRNCVKADTILTSALISVEGYQMKTDVSSEQGISFRTVCRAPDQGTVITIDNEDYTVTDFGIVYVKDPNDDGYHKDNILDKSYTLLNPVSYPQYEQGDSTGFQYIGSQAYDGAVLTFGYIASEEGILARESSYTTYVRTMTGMDSFVTNSLHIRAFVEAEDAEGNSALIYGESSSLISVASIAYQVYLGSLAPSREGHEYLYDSILSKLPTDSPYYLDTAIEYGWNAAVQP